MTVEMAQETCITCGISWAVPLPFQQKRKKDHVTYFCPNGHGQHWTGKSEEERLRDELARGEGPQMSRFFCYHCGADWSDWPGLSEEDEDALLEALPAQEYMNTHPSRLPEACPSCGFAYGEEDEDLY